MSKISLIIEREYLTRVQKKSFILMTILSPIVMVALIFAPIWLAQLSSDEVRQIAIIDQTGLYKNIYENSEEYQFTYTQGILNPAEMRAEESQPYAYVIIKDKNAREVYSCKVVKVRIANKPDYSVLYLVHSDVFDFSLVVPFSDIGTTVFFSETEALKSRKEWESSMLT